MKYVISDGGTIDVIKLFSKKMSDEVTIVVDANEPVHLLFLYEKKYNNVVPRSLIIDILKPIHVKISAWYDDFEVITDVIIKTKSNAECEYNFFVDGGFVTKHITTVTNGAGSRIAILGVYLLSGEQCCEIQTKQNHVIKKTTSSVNITGVVFDNASILYEGDIVVKDNAYGCQVHQINKNIVMGSNVHVNAKPGLRVANRDVICSHASATGGIDEDMLSFAHARGMTKQKAQTMILQGMLISVVSDTFLQEKIKEKIKMVAL